MDDATRAAARCPRCGNPLPADALDGLCPACLLTAGVETLTGASSDDAATISVGGSGSLDEGPRLEPGQFWGPYRIGRLLGRGGMGEVYEAEHTDSGRRIALKVLRGRLRNADDRARFLREGQLAASVSHPHTVYIFGSEEIAGMPVISMELLPGGTLKDRVAERGPMPPADAVAAILEIIGGLDAAQAAGILHRDIKPSNCFTDSDGTVKVGDFGLSISTLARDVRHELATSGFQGTPQFAPPEQLRGEPLDVRADIYAVGATLFYLLTGQPPFDSRDLRTLVERVTTEPPVSPRTLRREIPSGLASVVLRCLAKSPAERPATYAALADLLRPFLPHEETTAGVGRRLFAWLVDGLILSFIGGIGSGARLALTGVIPTPSPWGWVLSAVYFLFFEGLGGASPGKRLVGLAVTAGGARASWSQIAVRTLVYHLPAIAVGLLVSSETIVLFGDPLGEAGTRFTIDRGGIALALTALYFLTARKRNGWAALHDWVSGTRVVMRAARVARRQASIVTAPDSTVPAMTPSALRYGPFAAVSDAGETGSGRLVVAFDPVLRRRVWIHAVAPGTPAIDRVRRDVGRAGRLHWLTGKRSASENWDAFEAPDGRPLTSRFDASSHAEWAVVKHWLLDLSSELAAAEKDGSLPPLALSRLWLRSDGRLGLLDFPAPGAQAAGAPDRLMQPSEFLAAVADLGLPAKGDAGPVSIPLSARALIAEWRSVATPSIAQTRERLATTAAGPDRVTAVRRLIPIAFAAAPITMMVILAVMLVPMLVGFINSDDGAALSWLQTLAETPDADSRLRDPAIRDAAERYVAGRFGERIGSDEFWSGLMSQGGLAELRTTADAILERHPSVSADELAAVSATLAPEIEGARRRLISDRQDSGFAGAANVIIVCLAALATLVVVCGSLVSSIAAPGGLTTRMLGLAAVTRDGIEIGRGRSLARAVVAWLPALVWFVYLASAPKIQGWVPNPPAPLLSTVLVLGVLAVGAALTVWRRSQGPHDWVTGTWVVPR